MRIDLHIHTSRSDGARPPKKIVEEAIEGNLDLIAITDHDTVSGFLEAAEAEQGKIDVIPGIEFSTFYKDWEIHILGYFPSTIPDVVFQFAEESRAGRVERVRESIFNFEKLGIKLEMSEVKRFVIGEIVTRNHLANALVKRGIVSSVSEAFIKYLDYAKGIVPHLPLETEKAIGAIQEGGGKAVWAHPNLQVFDSQIESLVAFGLDGVEVYGGKTEGVYTYYLERVSEDFNLLKTGGSDFHGYARNFSLGDFFVGEEKVQDFLAAMGKAVK